MININLIVLGKIKENYFKDAINEYKKMLKSYADLSIFEIMDEPCPENLSDKDMEKVKNVEGEKILSKIKDGAYVIALEIGGKSLDSVAFADKINDLMIDGHSNITFVIGGSLGLSQEVLSRADYKLSFSKMTFPHKLMRVILMEQIYRAFRIINNHPYHKWGLMKLNLLNQVFSFHDFRLVNIENLSDKILLFFDQGLYFENTPEGQVDYMMTNPKLLLYKNEISFTKEELGEFTGNLIHSFDPDFYKEGELEELNDDFYNGVEINLYKDGTYKRISINELLRLDFEIINESFGYAYMRFSGIVTGFEDANDWQDASIEIFYNNEAELIYDSIEKL